jgi:hypothetical protein
MLHHADSSRILPSYLSWFTLVKKAQGEADMKLTNQMKQIIFLACPVDDLERGERG